jgi:hypothetical protein
MKHFFEYELTPSPFQKEKSKPLFSKIYIDMDGLSDSEILEKIFAWCNHGSGQECEEFLFAKIRSLSVGDFVTIGTCFSDCRKYRCESFGWTKIDN